MLAYLVVGDTSEIFVGDVPSDRGDSERSVDVFFLSDNISAVGLDGNTKILVGLNIL